MPKYKIELTRTAQKEVARLDVQIALRIKKKLQFFIDSGEPLGFAEPLTKPGDAGYRWRVGNYRVLFNERQGRITIMRVQHRREVYRKK